MYLRQAEVSEVIASLCYPPSGLYKNTGLTKRMCAKKVPTSGPETITLREGNSCMRS